MRGYILRHTDSQVDNRSVHYVVSDIHGNLFTAPADYLFIGMLFMDRRCLPLPALIHSADQGQEPTGLRRHLA